MRTRSDTMDSAVSPSHRRRETLLTRANPNPAREYLVVVHRAIGGTGLSVRLCYVPDKLLLDPEGLAIYLTGFGAEDIGAPEDVALTVLDDMNNEVVPRWVQVAVFQNAPDDRTGASNSPDLYRHAALAEDRHPNWDNPDLLRRIPGA
jgi:hypothetical protein